MEVERIDHVHVEVDDRDRAADWYERVLGLKREPKLAVWADDPMGPMILCGSDGMPTLSLFARECRPPSRDSTVAFRVHGRAFLIFLDELKRHALINAKGYTLTRANVVDHELSWSIYFIDPDGNRIEVTIYDYDEVRAKL